MSYNLVILFLSLLELIQSRGHDTGKFERLNYFYVARYKNGGPAGDVLYGRASSEAIGPPMCLSFPGCPLGWESGDNLKMLPEPTASCTLTEEGDQYNVHFSRGANGEVVSLRIEGEGIGTGNAELKRQTRVEERLTK